MLFLQENYREGILVLWVSISAIYLLISIRILYTCRKMGMRVWACAFIPVVNIFLLVKGIISRKKALSHKINL